VLEIFTANFIKKNLNHKNIEDIYCMFSMHVDDIMKNYNRVGFKLKK